MQITMPCPQVLWNVPIGREAQAQALGVRVATPDEFAELLGL